jgi:hypothetical protein
VEVKDDVIRTGQVVDVIDRDGRFFYGVLFDDAENGAPSCELPSETLELDKNADPRIDPQTGELKILSVSKTQIPLDWEATEMQRNRRRQISGLLATPGIIDGCLFCNNQLVPGNASGSTKEGTVVNCILFDTISIHDIKVVKGYDGCKDCIFNQDDRVLFTHDLLYLYWSLANGMAFDGFWKTLVTQYQHKGALLARDVKRFLNYRQRFADACVNFALCQQADYSTIFCGHENDDGSRCNGSEGMVADVMPLTLPRKTLQLLQQPWRTTPGPETMRIAQTPRVNVQYLLPQDCPTAKEFLKLFRNLARHVTGSQTFAPKAGRVISSGDGLTTSEWDEFVGMFSSVPSTMDAITTTRLRLLGELMALPWVERVANSKVKVTKCSHEQCTVRLASQRHLTAHVKHAHDNKNEFKHCPVDGCEFATKRNGTLDKHREKHNTEEKQCDKCSFICVTEAAMRDHQFTHGGSARRYLNPTVIHLMRALTSTYPVCSLVLYSDTDVLERLCARQDVLSLFDDDVEFASKR